MNKDELRKKYELRMKEAVAYVDKFWPYDGLPNEQIQIIKEVESKIMIYHEFLEDLNNLKEYIKEDETREDTENKNKTPFFTGFDF